MALIRIEGFDAAFRGSSPAEPLVIDAPVMCSRGGGLGTYDGEPTLTYGRLGGYGVSSGYLNSTSFGRQRLYPAFTTSNSTLIVGFALNIQTLSVTAGRIVIEDMFGVGNHIESLPSPGILRARINGNTYSMDVTDLQFPLVEWHYVECKVFFHASTGTVEWKLDGFTTATYTALNTGAAPTSWVPSIGGLNNSIYQGRFWFDDFYLCDGSGAANNNFLGDVQVLPLLPNGNGNSSVLLGSDANSVDNFLHVDERAINTADYVGSTTQGHKDTYDVRAVEFVAVGTAAGTAPGTATPGMPAGAVDGDILILVIEAEGEDANVDSGPVGWTLVDSVASAIDSQVDRTRCTVYWAWYSPSIDLTVPQAGDHTIAVVYAFRYVHPTTPFDVTASTGSNATNAVSHSAVTGLTSVTNRTMAVLALTHGDEAGFTFTNVANANLESVGNPGGASSTAGSDGMARILYGRLFTAGAIGTFSWDSGGISHENAWVAMVLRPASEIYASQVFGVQTTASIARTDVLDKYARFVVRSGSTDYVGASQLALTDPSYAPMLGMWEQDPNTSAAWTNSAVHAVEIGVEVRDS